MFLENLETKNINMIKPVINKHDVKLSELIWIILINWTRNNLSH